MVGCFLYAKLIRDILLLAGGGFVAYMLIRFRHSIFFPVMWPFAKLERDYDDTKYFTARPWISTACAGIGVIYVVCILLAFGWFVVKPLLIWLYHYYVVC